MTRAAAAATAAALAAGCAGETGTIVIDVVTAPGSTVLDDVTRVRVTLSRPYTVVEVERAPGGALPGLDLDVVAEGPNADLLLEGFDAGGALVAYGRTPPLPIAAVDASIAIYVGAPLSLDEAPVELDPPRTDLGTGPLAYGVVVAGGRDAAGAPTRDVAIYNAYEHELQIGEDLPAARAGIAVGAGATGYVYLFGGEDGDGMPQGNLWRFDTTVSPAGEWLVGTEAPDLARAGVGIAPLGSDAFLVLGTPPALLEGLALRAAAFELPLSLGGLAASVQREDEPGAPVYTLIVGDGASSTGVMRLAGGSFLVEEDVPADALRTGHAVIPTVTDEVLVVGGQDEAGTLLASAIRADPALRDYEGIPDLLATPRTDAAIAATASFLVVAGGRDAAGDLVPDAEIFALDTLAPVATVPMRVPRAGAVARPLPNQQVVILGGVDASGAPVGTIELFTPEPPPRPE